MLTDSEVLFVVLQAQKPCASSRFFRFLLGVWLLLRLWGTVLILWWFLDVRFGRIGTFIGWCFCRCRCRCQLFLSRRLFRTCNPFQLTYCFWFLNLIDIIIPVNFIYITQVMTQNFISFKNINNSFQSINIFQSNQ